MIGIFTTKVGCLRDRPDKFHVFTIYHATDFDIFLQRDRPKVCLVKSCLQEIVCRSVSQIDLKFICY